MVAERSFLRVGRDRNAFLILLAIILLFIPESNRWFRREPSQVSLGS